MEELPHEKPNPDLTLTERFFERAREAGLNSRVRFLFPANDLLTIITNSDLLTDFELRFQHLNSEEVKRAILRSMDETALTLEEAQKALEDRVDLIDRAGIAVTVSITIAGIVSLLNTGGSLLSVIGVAGGVIGLAISGGARYHIRRIARNREFTAKRIRLLIDHLKSVTWKS
jgi:hypothetical protein